MSDNWVVQNLQNALETWNEKLAEIWTLVTQSPQTFKDGSIWNVMVNIHGAVQAVGLALERAGQAALCILEKGVQEAENRFNGAV